MKSMTGRASSLFLAAASACIVVGCRENVVVVPDLLQTPSSGGVSENVDFGVPQHHPSTRDFATPQGNDEQDMAIATAPDMPSTVPGDDQILNLSIYGEVHDQMGLFVDPSGGALVVGQLNTVQRFGSVNLTAHGTDVNKTSDAFVVAMDSKASTARWGEIYGDPMSNQTATTIAIEDGVALMVGTTEGIIKFSDTIVLSGPETGASYVAAFDLITGKPLWATLVDGPAGTWLFSVVGDPTDHGFIVSGVTTGSVKWGSFQGVAGGGKDVIVAKVNGRTGALLWAKQIGDAKDQVAQAVACDGRYVYLAGQYNGSPNFGDGALTNIPLLSKAGIFVAKMNSADGATVKSAAFVPSVVRKISVGGVVSDGQDGFVLGGQYSGKVVINSAKNIALTEDASRASGFVARFNGNMEGQWARRIGSVETSTTDICNVNSLAYDSKGNIVAAGSIQGKVDFGLAQPISATRTDAFIWKLHGDGTSTWAMTTGGGLNELAYVVAVDRRDDSIWVSGVFDWQDDHDKVVKPHWGKQTMSIPFDEGMTHRTYLVHLVSDPMPASLKL